MRSVVLDASVVLKWCLPAEGETLVVEATELLSGYEAGRYRFLAPDLLWAEVGNGLWKAVRSQRIPLAEAAVAIELLRQLRVEILSSAVLLPDALQIALHYGRTVYDSLYVSAALHSSSELVTADERMVHALASRFPVSWLGAL